MQDYERAIIVGDEHTHGKAPTNTHGTGVKVLKHTSVIIESTEVHSNEGYSRYHNSILI